MYAGNIDAREGNLDLITLFQHVQYGIVGSFPSHCGLNLGVGLIQADRIVRLWTYSELGS